IFDGATNLDEQPGAPSITFNGLNLIATDDMTKNFRIRATFLTTVTDNDPITITITSVVASASGSGFAAPDGGGAGSGGGTNIIDVVADRLEFGAAPVGVNPATNFSLTVSAVDANHNVDKNRTNTVTLSMTSGSGSLTSTDGGGLTPNLSSGTRTWNQL